MNGAIERIFGKVLLLDEPKHLLFWGLHVRIRNALFIQREQGSSQMSNNEKSVHSANSRSMQSLIKIVEI